MTPRRPSADNAFKNDPIKTCFSSSADVWVWFFSQQGRGMKASWGLLERCLVLSSTEKATLLCMSKQGKQVEKKVTGKWHGQARIFSAIYPSLKLIGRDFRQHKITLACVFPAYWAFDFYERFK